MSALGGRALAGPPHARRTPQPLRRDPLLGTTDLGLIGHHRCVGKRNLAGRECGRLLAAAHDRIWLVRRTRIAVSWLETSKQG